MGLVLTCLSGPSAALGSAADAFAVPGNAEAFPLNIPTSDREIARVKRDLSKRIREHRQLTDEINELLALPQSKSRTMRIGKLARDRDNVEGFSVAACQRQAGKYGWFPIEPWGAEFSRDAAYLYRVIDEHFDFQDRILKTMAPLAASSQIDPRDFALMFDAVQVRRGLPQRFGTQGRCDAATGEYAIFALEDVDKVADFREAVGLESLEQDVEALAANCRASATAD